MTLGAGGGWCPECRDEYRPGRETCAECGKPLVAVLPVAEDVEGDDGSGLIDHSTQTLDVSTWSEAEWTAVRLLLSSASISTDRQGSTLVYPSARAAEVAELIDAVIGGVDVGVGDDEAVPSRTPAAAIYGARLPGGDVVAGGLRRLGGWVVDTVVVWIVFGSLMRSVLGPGRALGVVAFAGFAMYEVALIHLFGRTPGKVLLHTRVVDLASGELPSWWGALRRWAVPAAVLLAGYLPAWGPLLAPLGTVVVFGGVLLPRHRRGLHDVAAGTVVVLDG